MPRIRIIFEKTGLFTFVNHMDLPVIFSRAARRAGLSQEFTKGFSPHPRISLAAPLAIGVDGYCEPADFWFEKWDGGACARWNEMLPEGLRILKYLEIEEGPGLAKSANAAVYRISGADMKLNEAAAETAADAARKLNALYKYSFEDGVLTLSVCDLERCGAGVFVKALTEAGFINGWPDLQIERLLTGRWNEETGEAEPLL